MMQAVVQLRGNVNTRPDIRDTLRMLNLERVNHCTLVPETDAYRGMITKVNDVVAYGQPSQGVVETLLRRRAEPLESDEPIDDDWVQANTEYDDIEDLARALVDEETTLREQGLSPVLRLHPPRGGHGGIKHPTTEGGELGRHEGEAIDDLLRAMR